MKKNEKKNLLLIIQTNVYFGELSKEEIDMVVQKGLDDKLEDEKFVTGQMKKNE